MKIEEGKRYVRTQPALDARDQATFDFASRVAWLLNADLETRK